MTEPRTYPLSFDQQRLWFLWRLEPHGSLYNLARAVRLRGGLDVPALRTALDGVVARHEALRTSLPDRDGQPLQVVAPPAPTALPIVDLGRAAPEDRMRLLFTNHVVRPFDRGVVRQLVEQDFLVGLAHA